MSKTIGPALALLALLLRGAPLPAQVTPADSAALVTLSQRLMDGITNGDTATWSAALAPDWFLTDEEGGHVDRAMQLAALHPLPAGQSGAITVTHPRLTGGGDVAVISYDADEVHHYYGQTLVTTFHATDTYVRRDGRWWQLASQVTALPRVIDGIPITRSEAAPLVGAYRIAADIELLVQLQGRSLVTVRPGHPPQPLRQLARGIFVRDHVRGFWIFTRGPRGRVSALVDWRDNNAVTWVREP